ncbi:MAG: ferredoxin family protein [Chloroflexi bacterium]|nr:ferredoxin family protein [Chloroflexota bacterium]
MTHIITSLCLRDGACVDVCPVECIIPGQPQSEWPWYYIDPDTCIDCGACIPECPFEAIFTEDEVPADWTAARPDVKVNRREGTLAFEQTDHSGNLVTFTDLSELPEGESIDLTPDIAPNYDYFKDGPGYSAMG